jgi:hypothetical protein
VGRSGIGRDEAGRPEIEVVVRTHTRAHRRNRLPAETLTTHARLGQLPDRQKLRPRCPHPCLEIGPAGQREPPQNAL